jgi:hypothetical protein
MTDPVETPQSPPSVPAHQRRIGGTRRTVKNQAETCWAEADVGLLLRLHAALKELE